MHIGYKKTRLFLFLINVFWGVDSKSAIHFFRLALENPDNPEKKIFPDYRGFPVSDYKNGLDFSICFGRSKTSLLILRQFGKLASVGVTPRIFPTFTITQKQEELESSVLQ